MVFFRVYVYLLFFFFSLAYISQNSFKVLESFRILLERRTLQYDSTVKYLIICICSYHLNSANKNVQSLILSFVISYGVITSDIALQRISRLSEGSDNETLIKSLSEILPSLKIFLMWLYVILSHDETGELKTKLHGQLSVSPLPLFLNQLISLDQNTSIHKIKYTHDVFTPEDIDLENFLPLCHEHFKKLDFHTSDSGSNGSEDSISKYRISQILKIRETFFENNISVYLFYLYLMKH